jgi:hypothetical protein
LTLQQALSFPSDLHRLAALGRLLDSLSPAQFAAMHDEIVARAGLDRALLSLFLTRWVQLAPEAAMDAARNEETAGLWEAESDTLMAWGARDWNAAMAYAEKHLLDRRLRESLLALGFPKPGDLPPREAMQRIRELPWDGKRAFYAVNATEAIFQEWAKREPEAALREAMAMADDERGRELRRAAIGSVIGVQAATQSAAVAAFLATLPDGEERVALQAYYVQSLLASGHEREARTYAFALPKGPARQSALKDLAFSLALNDANAAASMLASLTPADWQDPAGFRDAFMFLFLKDAKRAEETLRTLSLRDTEVSEARQQAYARVLSDWAFSKPRAASEYIVTLPEGVRGVAFADTIERWSAEDPGAAAAFVGAQPASAARDAAMESIGANWATKGTREVTQWLEKLPPGSGKSAAVEGFARTIISTSPDDALAWLRSVPDQTDRIKRLGRVWSGWKNRDAAEAWLEKSPDLTAAERAALKRLPSSK